MPEARGESFEEWLSVVIPVYRESDAEMLSLFHWIEQNHTTGIGWIISRAENDRTSRIFQQASTDASDKDKDQFGIASKVNVQVTESGKGRSMQMNAGARLACGKILLFLHADTRLSGDWSSAVRRAVDIDGAVWGAFAPRIAARGILYRVAEVWGEWRSCVLGLPYGDQALFITSAQFRQLGGFDEVVQFMEDVDMAQRKASLNDTRGKNVSSQVGI